MLESYLFTENPCWNIELGAGTWTNDWQILKIIFNHTSVERLEHRQTVSR